MDHMNDFLISVKSVMLLPGGKTQEDTTSPSIQPAGTQPHSRWCQLLSMLWTKF